MINNIKIPEIIGIYKIISPSNKIYIGQSIDIIRRWGYYENYNCKSQPKLFNSLNKHRYENHIFDIIEECSVELLNERETYWKLYYLTQNQNNWDRVLFCELHDGGGGPKSEATKQKMRKPKPLGFGFGKKHSDSARLKMSSKRYSEEQKERMRKPKLTSKKGKDNGNFGKIRSKEVIEKTLKPIYQFDLMGNFIKEWVSVKEANISLGKEPNASSISLCLGGKYRRAFGFVWKYKNIEEFGLDIKTKFNNIIQIDLKGNIINEFINPTSAQDTTGINSGAIWFCLKKKTQSAGGFIWKYKNTSDKE